MFYFTQENDRLNLEINYIFMAVLAKKEIIKRLKDKDIDFDPEIDNFQLQPHAIDLRLGYKFLIPKNWHLTNKGRSAIKISIDDTDIHREQFEEVILKPGQYFELLPNEFVIATSLETIKMKAPDLMAILFPRTSTNRRGVSLSLSGIIDTGYQGQLIFPMKNEAGNQVLRLYPGERICQVIFHHLSSELSPEEAKMHGLQNAKYTEKNSSHYQLDRNEERELLIQGKIEELKKRFKL